MSPLYDVSLSLVRCSIQGVVPSLTGVGEGGWLTLCRDFKGPCLGLRERNFPGWTAGKPRCLRVAVLLIHRLYEVQGRETSVLDSLSKERKYKGLAV